MQNSVSERLKKVVSDFDGNLKEFAKQCGIPYRTLQDYIAGKREPGAANLIKIATQMRISIDWLLTGESQVKEESSIYNAIPHDIITEKILLMIKDMSEEERREILKYVQHRFSQSDNRRTKIRISIGII